MQSHFGTMLPLLLLASTAFIAIDLVPVRAANPDLAQVEGSAVSCLVKNYNSTIGLIHESPDSSTLRNTYWLYSDNYLAGLALDQSGSGNSTVVAVAANVTQTTRDYLDRVPGAVNQYLSLENPMYSYDDPSNYPVTTREGATIGVTLNNGTGILEPSQYADAAFLAAVSYMRNGNVGAARASWAEGNASWDGIGFADSAFTDPKSQSFGQYQAYKLALYIYASELTDEPYSMSAFYQLLKMQASGTKDDGCFYTGYGSNFTAKTGVNTETTSLAILALNPISCSTPSGVSQPTTVATVGTFLYLWYGFNQTDMKWTGGLGSSHWNTTDGTVVDRPSIGYYASDSNATLAWQLSNMKAAGISAIIVSWWGSGNTTQSGDQAVLDSAINNATLNLFRYLESIKSQWGFKVAVMVEGFNSGNYTMTVRDYAHVYGYLEAHYYHPYADLVLNWLGKPLVMFFNTPTMNSVREVPQNLSYAFRLVGGYPNKVDWYFWEGMNFLDSSGGTNVTPSDYMRSLNISSDGEVGVAPRYDDYYLHVAYPYIRTGYMRFDYDLSEGMYYSEWSGVIQKAPDVKLVLLDSWNEYHERTAIEPHSDLTAGYFAGGPSAACYVDAMSVTRKPEFPFQALVILVATAFVILSYVAVRRFKR